MKWALLATFFFATPVSGKSTGYLLTRYMAKEYCSCRYVVKQSPKVCKNENKTTKALFKLVEDEKSKVIRVSNLLHKAQAHFVDERYGCILDTES